MKKYTPKPITVEAMQFTEETSIEELMNFMDIKDQGNLPEFGHGIDTLDYDVPFEITTNHGVQDVNPLDYIVKGSMGQFEVKNPDVFEQEYDELFDITTVPYSIIT